MKTRIIKLFLLPTLIAGFGLIPAGRVTAQTFTTLHSFTGDANTNNATLLILSGNVLYGTSSGSVSPDVGTVFAVNTDGTGFTILHTFTLGFYDSSGNYINSDGANPNAGLIVSGNTLYGTAAFGGSSGNGTVFKVNTDGTGFTTLYSFSEFSGYNDILAGMNSDGVGQWDKLIVSGNTLYGTSVFGGSSASGTVFKVNTDGTGFTSLYSFTASPYPFTNSDGSGPGYLGGGLILSGSTLYGQASSGGSSGDGTIFAVNTDGTGFTNLHSFTASSGGSGPRELILSGNTFYGTAGTEVSANTVFSVNTNGTGFTNLHSITGGSRGIDLPESILILNELILSGNTLYGITYSGGSSSNGTVFAVNTDGTGFTNLHTFTALSNSTNGDGAYPTGLFLSGNTLYGTAGKGGSSGNGTVFGVNTDGTGFTNLYDFTGGSDGAYPLGSLLSGSALYGTTYGGGSSGHGTVFSLSLPRPQLTITLAGTNVILTWSTNAAGFTLQSTTNLTPPIIWSDSAGASTVVGTQFTVTVTNTNSAAARFFRLKQP